VLTAKPYKEVLPLRVQSVFPHLLFPLEGPFIRLMSPTLGTVLENLTEPFGPRQAAIVDPWAF